MECTDIFEQVRQEVCVASAVQNLLPSGHREGDDWIAINPTRDDQHKGSFRVSLKTGRWIDFATSDRGGDVVDLYAYLSGLNQHEAAKTLLEGEVHFPTLPPPKPPNSPKVSRLECAQKIWDECHSPEKSMVSSYLQARGYCGEIPNVIRFHARLYHSPTQSHYPAMVAKITIWPSDELAGIHRTYLSSNGGKAAIANNKMMLGSSGVVQLAPKVGRQLILAEGIETALSVWLATGIPAWAALSTSGLRNVVLPPPPMEIILAADHDNPGISAAETLADRLLSQGYRVKITKPTQENSDFNDLLRRAV